MSATTGDPPMRLVRYQVWEALSPRGCVNSAEAGTQRKTMIINANSDGRWLREG